MGSSTILLLWRALAGIAFLSVTNSRAGATPDHQVKVAEQFLGSNETGFATLRTETDNCGAEQ